MLNIAIEEYPFEIFILMALTAGLFFLKKNNSKKTVLTKQKIYSGSTLQSLIYKTFIFLIIAWLLSYLFNILTLVSTSTPQFINITLIELKENGIPVSSFTIVSIWLAFLMHSMLNLSLTAIIGNLFTSFIFSSTYIYFNIQLSFATIILVFLSYHDVANSASFLISFIIISLAIFTSVLFFKFKKGLLAKIRNYYLSTPIGNRTTKITEFYVICAPYIIYSVLFSITLLSNEFNLGIQLLIAHLFSYFIIYKMYQSGHDIGFDYDPF
ncbi:hypothetical protein [Crenothrix polyspora]|uniref:Uncharacterized protein n=1 Tax=Crenothrix polyspora TaxID=360316 RepID=A0A1R4HGD2_9GAMM|nr:hypothetical protein [Crenothrix polyspora]SJM95285.1 membrane hypothetical protein [Crenothrix polyspora]